MRYKYLFVRRNPYVQKQYKYNSRHMLLKFLSPRELNFLLYNINRRKFILTLAKKKIDYIEFIAYSMNKIMSDKKLRDKFYKGFHKSKIGYLEKDTILKRKKINLLQDIQLNLTEIFNFGYNKEQINTYNKLFND